MERPSVNSSVSERKVFHAFNRETSTGGLTTASWMMIIPETSAWVLIRFPMTWTQRLPSQLQVTTARRRCIFSKVKPDVQEDEEALYLLSFGHEDDEMSPLH